MNPEEVHLFFCQGASDKVYNLALTQCETGWTVTAAWGRRGSVLSAETKVERAEYAAAKKLYDSVLRQKLAKGYKPVQAVQSSGSTAEVAAGTAQSVPLPQANARPSEAAPSFGPALTRARRPVSKDVVFAAELLTRISESELDLYTRSSRHWFQIKRDGIRLTIVGDKIENSDLYEIFGYNKLGQVVQLDARLYLAVKKLMQQGSFNRIMIDGEWETSGFWGWDLLELDGDLRGMEYGDRFDGLVDLFNLLPTDLAAMFHPVETARTTAEKQALLAKAKATRAEGLAVKLVSAPHRGGRNGQHSKFKFEQTASFIVGPKPKADTHRSVALYLYDKGRKRYMGSVKVADRYAVPADGAIVDVRYLYCFQGVDGHIYQPAYFGVTRTDVRPEDCVVQQLKMKQDQEDAAA